ncbi:hypothetical protein TKK_0017643 [Trichogramma kaykai]|uniref:Uncharacterized protein n=1 Tax=Trichogramma kaykai TaxID=54128 RepID=A0ABD2W2G5_9HYME
MSKIALRIQNAEEQFSNLFIHLGPFHIMLSYHKALGKFINGSGSTNVLIVSEVLSSGSIRTFLDGKYFSRSRKIHPLLSLALRILHFKGFLEEEKLELDSLNNVKTFLTSFNNQNDHQMLDSSTYEILENYEAYTADTFSKKHGKTPEIFLLYTKLVDYYIMMELSIRQADLEIYKFTLSKISNIFFIMNHQNYAKYLTIYLDKLENIESSHPGLLNDYKDCTFGIRRTTKPLSRIPIDLTLEQTVNKDAA